MANNGLVIRFFADTNSAVADIGKLERALGRTANAGEKMGALSGKVKAFGAAAAAAGGALAIKLAAESIDAGSKMIESQSKVAVVFGRSAGAIEKWADTSAESMVMSSQAALEAAGTYGNLFQAFGIGQEQAAGMSQTLVQLAADLASFNNTSTDDAIQALRSGLSGETEPLKRYGVALTDARMKQEALNMGIYDGKGILDANQKAQAAYALILKDTSLAQGDVARTSDNYANTMRRMNAEVDNAKTKIGIELVGAIQNVTAAMGGADSAADSIANMGDYVADVTAGIGKMTAAVVDYLNMVEGDTTSKPWYEGVVESVPYLGMVAKAAREMGEADRDRRQAVDDLADELSRAAYMEDVYAGKTAASNVESKNQTKYAEQATEAINALNNAMDRANGGRRGLLAANIRLREMRREGPRDLDGDKKISSDERKQFGLDYAGVVDDKYDALVGMGKLRKADRLLRRERRFLNSQVGGGFGGTYLSTPDELPAAIAAKDRARSEAGANQWRATMSSVFGGEVTININAETPEQAVQQAKQWARLAATGRGPVMPTDYAGRPGAPSRRGGALGLNPATGGAR